MEPDARNGSGATALAFAAMFGREELAKALLARGADPTLTDAEGRTAAGHARREGNTELAELLERAQAADPKR